MGVLCAYRSTQTGLWVNNAGQPGVMAQIKAAGTSPIVISAVSGEIGVFGGSYLNKANPSVAKSPMWPGFQNCPDGTTAFAILVRIIPRWTGSPGSIDLLAMQASNPNRGALLDFVALSNGTFRFTYIDADGQTGASSITTTNTYTGYVSGTAVDLMFSWDGTTNAGSAQFSVNGTLLQALTPGNPAFNISQLVRTGIVMGNNANAAIMNADINEFVLFNNAQSPTYSVRTGFWPVSAFDASANIDPGVGHVGLGVAYEIAGVPLVGTVGPSTDPGVGNVANGVGYEINGVNKVGTLNAVTNVLAAATLQGQSLQATLTES